MFDVVTGGAGFIGSHLVDTLVAQGNEVLVIDSLCAGRRETIARHIADSKVRFVQMDLLEDGWQEHLEGADRLFHLAADPDVRQSAVNPYPAMQNNIMATYRVLEAMRLPEPICDALLGRGGRYQPFLDLALASERDDGAAIADQAAMLGLTATHFNRAQIQALAFADAMEF